MNTKQLIKEVNEGCILAKIERKEIIELLEEGEANKKYKKMWEWLKATWIRKDDDCSKIWFEIDGENLKGVINELDELVDHIEQLCSPKEESK